MDKSGFLQAHAKVDDDFSRDTALFRGALVWRADGHRAVMVAFHISRDNHSV